MIARKIYNDLKVMPNSYDSPWLISYCTDEDNTINHFSFQLINSVEIGRVPGNECDKCNSKKVSTMEVQIQHRLRKILI